jgi:hypothetical protein
VSQAALTRARAEPDPAKWIVPVAFVGATAIFLDQISETVVTLAGAPAATSEWRFQSAAYLISRLPALTLGALGGIWVAERFGRPFARRLFQLVLLLVAVGLLLSGVMLWIDGLAFRALIPEAAREAFLFRWIRALVLTSLGVLMFLLIAVRARMGRKTTG